MYSYEIRWFGINIFVRKAPQLEEAVKIKASAPPLPSFENVINYIYSYATEIQLLNWIVLILVK